MVNTFWPRSPISWRHVYFFLDFILWSNTTLKYRCTLTMSNRIRSAYLNRRLLKGCEERITAYLYNYQQKSKSKLWGRKGYRYLGHQHPMRSLQVGRAHQLSLVSRCRLLQQTSSVSCHKVEYNNLVHILLWFAIYEVYTLQSTPKAHMVYTEIWAPINDLLRLK